MFGIFREALDSPNGQYVFSTFLLLNVFYTHLMRPNKVETDHWHDAIDCWMVPYDVGDRF